MVSFYSQAGSAYSPRLRPLLGTAVFLVTAVPWHVLAAWQNRATGASRGFIWFYFVNDQINRYLNTRIPRDYDKVPLLLFYALVLVWALPWGAFLFRATWRWIAAWRAGRQTLNSPVVALALWALLIIGFFTFSTRQEYYTIPAIPALALLAGVTLAQRDRERKSGRSSYIVLCAGSALLAGMCLLLFAVAKAPAARHGTVAGSYRSTRRTTPSPSDTSSTSPRLRSDSSACPCCSWR